MFKYKKAIVLTLFATAFLIVLVISYIEFIDVKMNTEIANGEIIKADRGYRGGVEMEYLYYVNNDTLKGGTGYTAILSSKANCLVGKPVLVAYSKINPKHKHLLLLSIDYEKFNMTMPDKMKWVLKYVR